MIVVRDSDYVTSGFETLKDAVECAEYLHEVYPTSAIKIEGHEFGDLGVDSARAIVEFEDSEIDLFELTDQLDDMGWNEKCINALIDVLHRAEG